MTKDRQLRFRESSEDFGRQEKTRRVDDKPSVSFEAVCERIVFRNDENGYTVASFFGEEVTDSDSGGIRDEAQSRISSPSGTGKRKADSLVAVGYFPFLEEGDRALLRGTWATHPTFGKQLVTDSVLPLVPHTEEEILTFLSSGAITGIGPKTAQRIVAKFGEDTIRVLRDEPERLSTMKGISVAKSKEISRMIREKEDYRELTILLLPAQIGLRRINEIYSRYGTQAIHRIRENPYILAQEITGIGFHTADQIAARLGLDPSSQERYAAASLYSLRLFENDGHTYADYKDLYLAVCRLLLDENDPNARPAPETETSVPAQEKATGQTDTFARCIETLRTRQRIVLFSLMEDGSFSIAQDVSRTDRLRVAFPRLLAAELSSAKRLSLMRQSGSVRKKADIRTEIEEISVRAGILLSEEQQDAILLAVDSAASVITGGPGTGKTTIIKILNEYFRAEGKKVVLCAPTGRAAKRMSEASGGQAKTIHRLLEPNPNASDERTAPFKKDENNPIDAEVVIVDESSMLDVILFDSLLRAVPAEARIIFVGDVNQLPSVGAGNVLADVIGSGMVPVAFLTRIYRQAQESGIVRNAYRILAGESIIFDQSFDSDCMLIAKNSAEDLAQAAISLYAKVLPDTYGIDTQKDVAVLCPSRKGAAGVNELNDRLQAAVGGGKGASITSHKTRLFLRDKVMQTRNNYELSYENADRTTGTGVFNGELGTVTGVDEDDGILAVTMDDGRKVTYDRDTVEDLDPAYAVTVHKSQGCEYPVVILVIAPGYYALNNRNLLYTAVTRAKSRLFIVSSRRVLDRAIASLYIAERKTTLCAFLRIYANEGHKTGEDRE